MSTAAQVLAEARKDLGYYSARPNGRSKYGIWYGDLPSVRDAGFDAAPFCAMAVSYWAMKAKATNIIPVHAYTPSGVNWFKARKQWHTGRTSGRVGDIAYMRFSGSRVHHVGIVEKVLGGGRYQLIEANTSGTAGGNQRNGGVVARKTRSVGSAGIQGFGRPKYGSSDPRSWLQVGDTGSAVKDLQKSLIAAGYDLGPGGADGVFGAATEAAVRAVQEAAKITVDGWAGKDTMEALKPAKPSGPVKVRVGTLNIPLDAAKLPDGRARVIVAARQVHEANLAILACQELDRGRKGDTWYFARLMLSALREHDKTWKIIKPTHAANENTIFYRPSKATLKRRLDDVILTSSAGSRHATRATFTVGGRTLAVRNTHLVEGAKNDKAREQQAKQLAAVSGASTIILGDLNTPDLPAPLAKTHKSAKDHAKATTNAAAGTYAKWGECDVTGQVLDHIVVPKKWTVNGYTIVGATGQTLDQPRASDHLLVVASLTIGE